MPRAGYRDVVTNDEHARQKRQRSPFARRRAGIAATVAAVAIGTVLLSRWWYWHPSYFPSLPSSVWALFERLVDSERANAVYDAELLGVAATAFIVCTVAVIGLRCVVVRLWRRRSADTSA